MNIFSNLCIDHWHLLRSLCCSISKVLTNAKLHLTCHQPISAILCCGGHWMQSRVRRLVLGYEFKFPVAGYDNQSPLMLLWNDCWWASDIFNVIFKSTRAMYICICKLLLHPVVELYKRFVLAVTSFTVCRINVYSLMVITPVRAQGVKLGQPHSTWMSWKFQ